MRKNEYENLKQFYDEFSEKPNPNGDTSIGVEFVYNKIYYRMCHEPEWANLPKDESVKQYGFAVYEVDWYGEIFNPNFTYIVIGLYHNLDEVLENCILQGRKFKDVIIDDEIEIVCRDQKKD